MDTVTRPAQWIGAWLKENNHADVTHCILRYDGKLLITYCGRSVPLQDASKPVMGARHCTECEILRRRHMKARENHVTKIASKR